MEEDDSYEIWKRGGGGGDGLPKFGRDSHGCGLWKNIRMGWETFSHCTGFVNGVENWVRFWHDCWGGDHPLKAVFPVLYENLGCEVPS